MGGSNLKPFYEQPILNSPYYHATRYHALGDDDHPLEHELFEGRRRSRYMVPVRRSRKQSPKAQQSELLLEDESGSTRYNPSVIVNEIRAYVEAWRGLRGPADWGVTPATQRLLQH